MTCNILLCMFLSCADAILTTLVFIRGNEWSLFQKPFVKETFSTNFMDICFFTYLRASIIIGASIGTLINKKDGPQRLQKCSSLSKIIAGANGYYCCIKLLLFAEEVVFVASPMLYWFWGLFSCSLIGCVLFIYQWNFLASYKKTDVLEVNAEDCNSETKNLLPSAILINGDINESQSSSSTDDDFEKSDKEKRGSKVKSLTELASKATIKEMLMYTLPDIHLCLIGLFFLIGAAVAEIFIPLYTGKVISGIVVAGQSKNFIRDLLEMALISIVASICAGLRAGFLMLTIQRFNIRVRNALFKSVTKQELGFFDKTRTGNITSRLTSDTTTMSDTIGLEMNCFIRTVIKGLGVCVFMFSLSWKMSVITFMGLPLVFAVSEVYGDYYKRLQKVVQDKFAIANEVAEEVCSSMLTVRSFANEGGERERYSKKLLMFTKCRRSKRCLIQGIFGVQSFQLLFLVLTLWYGGILLMAGSLSAQNFIAFILYQEQLGDCFNEIGEVYTGMMQALGAAEKVFELIKREPSIKLEEGKLDNVDVDGKVSFIDISFSYPSRPDQQILKEVSFDVEPGEVVALVGPSGGGKSSCVKLLQRFYQPSEGSVLLDGNSIDSYKHDFLHKKISMVGQEPVLYARSIRDNIIYGLDSTSYTEQMIVEAAIKANAHSFITELKDQYDTECGEKGAQLSGGQKQRIAIARALVRNPKVLLLDEATSALDTESEFLVQEALERSKSDRTVILIAHRLSTVERADKIIVIDKGQVLEQGNHQELMSKRGKYYTLVYRQLHLSSKLANSNSQDILHFSDSSSNQKISKPKEISKTRTRTKSKSTNIASSLSSESSVGSPMRRNF